jgi:hypothetical protein
MNNESIPTVNVPYPVEKGSIVRYKDGWMEVKAKFKTHVNLGHIFHSKTTIKKVPLNEVYEDRGEWYENWSKSETYQSM